MKLASYVHHGRKSYGILTDTGIIDLGSKIGHQYRTLKDLLQWGAIEIAGQYVNYPVDVMMADITFLPVIADNTAVAIVTPAEGPSFGTAPSGT